MFGLSVFITVLLIGMIWFRSFQKNLYVLMNPKDDFEKALAVENVPMPSLFGYVGKSLAGIKGLISELFGGQQPENQETRLPGNQEAKKVYILPLSDSK